MHIPSKPFTKKKKKQGEKKWPRNQKRVWPLSLWAHMKVGHWSSAVNSHYSTATTPLLALFSRLPYKCLPVPGPSVPLILRLSTFPSSLPTLADSHSPPPLDHCPHRLTPTPSPLPGRKYTALAEELSSPFLRARCRPRVSVCVSLPHCDSEGRRDKPRARAHTSL